MAVTQPTEVDKEMAVETIWSSTTSLLWEFLDHLPLLGLAMVTLLLTWLTARLFSHSGHKLAPMLGASEALEHILTRILVVTTWVVGLMLTAMLLFPGLEPADALAGLGAGSVVIGFAFKDIFENFMAGLFLLGKMPFARGDVIAVDGVLGRLENIDLRQTYIRELDGDLVILPNARIFKHVTHVKTSWTKTRETLTCGVSYGTDLGRAIKLMQETVRGLESVDREKPVEVFGFEFGDSGINFMIRWWTSSQPASALASRSEVLTALKRALGSAGIEIPFPHRTHIFPEPLRIERDAQDKRDRSTARAPDDADDGVRASTGHKGRGDHWEDGIVDPVRDAHEDGTGEATVEGALTDNDDKNGDGKNAKDKDKDKVKD